MTTQHDTLTDYREAIIRLPPDIDAYRLHQATHERFSEPGQSRNFIYSRIATPDNKPAMIIRGHLTRADLPAESMRPATPPNTGDRFRFLLSANLMKRNRTGSQHQVPLSADFDEYRKNWIIRAGERSGFVTTDVTFTTSTIQIQKPNGQFRLIVTNYAGNIEITDKEKFTRPFLTGIGDGRTWGCGTFILKPAA